MIRLFVLFILVFGISTSCYGGKPLMSQKKTAHSTVQKKIVPNKRKVVRQSMQKICISSYPNLSTDEKIVALTIIAESKGEGAKGMYAVGCVIKQRSLNRKKILSDICLQWKQFSCWNHWNDKNFAQMARLTFKGVSQEIVDYAVKLSQQLVLGRDLDRSFVCYSDYYCRVDINPVWAKGIDPLVVIGNHKFFDL